MYEQYFRLSENPFRLTPDPRFLYITPKHRESLSALVYGVLARKGFLVVTGDAGTGKTTLIHSVLGMLSERKIECAFIFHPLLEPDEFLEHVLVDLGVNPPPGRKKGDMLRMLHQFLLKRHEQGTTTALIVDEAHKLTAPLLEEIRLFSNLETSTDKLLQIVLAGQTELDDLFRRDDLRQLKQRISIRTRLSPFNLQQTTEYLAHRLQFAGRKSTELFPPQTIPLIFKLSRGIPRVINSLCDNALLLAFAQQVESVTIPILREVAVDLDLGDIHLESPSEAANGNGNGNGARHEPAAGLAHEPEGVPVPVAEPEHEAELALQGAPQSPAAVTPNANGPGFKTLDSYGERKGTMNLLTKWADRFRNS
jgi:general secretion pathway protein A